jgi:NADPH-dependent 2,4-dienoyl-CoA reductase/sulfur reductase-like enzyme/nitrite reductase/ring-hydroxylating ferredoxin subunit
MSEEKQSNGPDFSAGVPRADIADGAMLVGHVGDEPVLLARRGDEFFAIGTECTHYHGPLAEGLVVGDTVRCPWHHACFSLRTGEALRAPALDPVACWHVERQGDAVFVRRKVEPTSRPARRPSASEPQSVAIIGGGAAAQAAAEMLRREGYAGPVTIFSADDERPYDRPNLSKDYLAGTAPEDWLALRPPEFYAEHGLALELGARVAAIDPKAREIRLANGARHSWGALLLATGAEPIRLKTPGADLPHVRTLRTLADCRALIARAQAARRAVVAGASFIGLEVAASLRARGIEVDVVAPEAVPMERLFGAEIGRLVRRVHEQNGVRFHLGAEVASIDARNVALTSGERVTADLVVVGIGVRPLTDLAEHAGIAVDRGVTVDAFLATSVSGIWAAGDIARWPDRLTGEKLRIEHWVVAERQGQTAARNMLGMAERFDQVPLFWTQQHDLTLSYVGHARHWDRIDIDGSLDARDATVTYRLEGRKLAVLTVGRDRDSLAAERELEQSAAAG